MIFHSLLGSVLHRVVTWTLIITMTSTSTIPLIQQMPRTMSAHLEMMEQLAMPKFALASLMNVRQAAPGGREEGVGERVNGLAMPTIGSYGEPVGMLLGTGAFETSKEELESPALPDPLSMSRAQSVYVPTDTLSNTLIITFTVTNNHPPGIVPDVPITSTITDTIESLSGMDFSNDPNVIHDVLLNDDLLPGNASFIAAEPVPDRDDDSLAWNLGDIPPLGSITVTLKVQIPHNVSDFLELDAGATVWGTLEGQMVSASSAPVTLVPDSFSEWLIWTTDADYYDKYMVHRSIQLGQDPLRAFEYVQSLGYESYKGSLRGTRGTLWSEAGNSLDQASLLIAMLRGSGIPARYRHGTLSKERAQELILSMFPEPQGTIGHIPKGTEVADPANDPQLLEETIDHWWVEAYLPGLGWTDLDPSFANAGVGSIFVESIATDGTDRIVEVPDSLRHKVTMKVKVERAESIAALIPNNLPVSYPLTHTFNTVELVGEPVTLGHLVNTEGQTGAVFYNLQHTYVPYFAVGDFETVIEDEPFQELVSNFP